jgi:sterol desaturase/sphingolipid hydroxylase (fatty acid hydroxylase superfamily)
MEIGADAWRFGLLWGALALLLVLETLQAPRSGRPRRRAARWGLNLTLGGVGFGLGRVLAVIGPVAVAEWAASQGIGLLAWASAPPAMAFVLAFLALDLAVYAQHRALHENAFLWRLHRVHHTDTTLDVTTAWRFHPLELVGSLFWKSAVVIAVGAPLEAVLVYEAALALGALFTHADIRLSPWVDQALRLVIATPAAHERHHGVIASDQKTNYGGVMTLWDRLFGSWRAPGAAGMGALGLDGVSAQTADRVGQGLLDPFRQR